MGTRDSATFPHTAAAAADTDDDAAGQLPGPIGILQTVLYYYVVRACVPLGSRIHTYT